ncbi:PTS sugar transporter subunit IIC [Wukongibacter sp. M2B1]|uniref:PTS sugar transporter subunit IIC n=1 Tax=Wukongibacter sp. M2B1 TaxID=3088895 RepID=UPI003D790F0D
MKKIIAFLEKYFVPVAAKLGTQRHLVAIRDGFIAIMPLIIAGSIAVLINYLAYDSYQAFMTNIFGQNWQSYGSAILWGSFTIMSMLISFTVAYNLGKSYDINPLSAGLVSFSSFIIFIPQTFNVTIGQTVGDIAVPAELVGKQLSANGISSAFTGPMALFVALIVAIVSTELFVRLTKTDKLAIKMPDNVPPAVARSFAVLFPTIIVMLVSAAVAVFINSTGTSLFEYITSTIQEPFMKLGSSMGAAILIAFFNHLLWFFGLHGPAILEPLMQTLNAPAVAANLEAITNNAKPMFIVTKPFFDAFVYMGGSGTTICLLAAIIVASKRKHYRNIAKLGGAPAFFNINEPVIFGMPIVLNPIFMIPFILCPVVLAIVAYLATSMGLVPYTTVAMPWTSPPIIGGIIATGGSLRGGLLAAINLIIGFLIYMPFVIMAEKLENTEKSK